jgi:beta-barrel assembly-enhancing protease
MPKLTIILSIFLLSIATPLFFLPVEAKAAKKPIILISGPETTEFLDTIAKPLLKAAGIAPKRVHFYVVLNSNLNAMALESNDIIFNSELLLQTQSIDEVAGVMAHEIAHLAAGHHIKLKSEMKNVSMQTLLYSLVGVAAGIATGSGEVAQAAIMGGTASGHSQLLSSQRQKETQADRLAIYYMVKAGFDPHGLATFMTKLHQAQRSASLPAPYLLSHPASADRVVEIQRMAERMRPSFFHPSRENGKLRRIQAKIMATSMGTPDMAVNHFRAKLKKRPNDFTSRYGLAIALRYTGQLPESEAQFNRLLKQRPKDPYLYRERGRTRTDWGRAVQAEGDFRTSLKYHPKHPDLLYWLAFSLKEQEKYRSAGRILRRLTIQHPKRANYFYLLAMVEGKGQRPAPGHLALGRYYALKLEKKTALWHFNESIRLYSTGSIEQNIARLEKKRLLDLFKKR